MAGNLAGAAFESSTAFQLQPKSPASPLTAEYASSQFRASRHDSTTAALTIQRQGSVSHRRLFLVIATAQTVGDITAGPHFRRQLPLRLRLRRFLPLIGPAILNVTATGLPRHKRHRKIPIVYSGPGGASQRVLTQSLCDCAVLIRDGCSQR